MTKKDELERICKRIDTLRSEKTDVDIESIVGELSVKGETEKKIFTIFADNYSRIDEFSTDYLLEGYFNEDVNYLRIIKNAFYSTAPGFLFHSPLLMLTGGFTGAGLTHFNEMKLKYYNMASVYNKAFFGAALVHAACFVFDIPGSDLLRVFVAALGAYAGHISGMNKAEKDYDIYGNAEDVPKEIKVASNKRSEVKRKKLLERTLTQFEYHQYEKENAEGGI